MFYGVWKYWCIFFCLFLFSTIVAKSPSTSQIFLNRLTQQKSLQKPRRLELRIYRRVSQLITVIAGVYMMSMLYVLYKDAGANSSMQLCLPRSVIRWNTFCSVIVGSCALGLQVLLYKTIAHVLLIITIGSPKDIADYLFKKNICLRD